MMSTEVPRCAACARGQHEQCAGTCYCPDRYHDFTTPAVPDAGPITCVADLPRVFLSIADDLAVAAWRLRAKRQSPARGLLLVFELDSLWRPFVDLLMPDHDWAAVRARGKPFALIGMRRSALGGLLPTLVREEPTIRMAFERRPQGGSYDVLVLADCAAGLASVEPRCPAS